jgi:hypothetical protein
MIYNFETIDYGRVEIDTEKSEAYFFARDESYTIDGRTGEFNDFNGTRFEFIAPALGTRNRDAILQVWQARTIGRDTRTSARSAPGGSYTVDPAQRGDGG